MSLMYRVSVDLGASKSVEECQYQFSDRHWNCSTVRDGSVFGPVLTHGECRGFY